jgi:signal transduction histidine kinase
MGRVQFEPSEVDLSAQVTTSIEVLQGMADKKEITLQNQVAPDIIVFADENMLDSVIRNLISNALKFTPSAGTVTVTAREVPLDGLVEGEIGQPQLPPATFVEISVADTGVGINPKDLGKLFKFNTLHTTYGTAHEKGTGLGLIICKEMIEKHGGQIWVESEEGQGTTIKFTLPLVD